MSNEQPLQTERESVSQLGVEMLESNLTTGSGGNVSVRRDNQIAVSPSGVAYKDVTADRVPVVDTDGRLVTEEGVPSNETPMHTMIYRQREDVGGIVHTHSPYASTFASLDEPIPASHYLIAYAGTEVPVAGYAPPGSDELAQLAVDALGDEYNACLLQNHGVMALGEDGESALETAVMVEYCARIHYQAQSIGTPTVLQDEDLEYLIDMFESYRKKGK